MSSARTLIVCVISSAIASFFGGRIAAPMAARESPGVLEEVRTRRLVLVDEEGEERGLFVVGTKSGVSAVSLWMGGPNGTDPCATLWVEDHVLGPRAGLLLRSQGEAQPSTGQLRLCCASGLPTASLAFSEGATRGCILLGPRLPLFNSTTVLTYDSGEGETAWPSR